MPPNGSIFLAPFLVKLLFDQNISYRLVSPLKDLFPESNHVRLLGLEKASDEDIWEYAKRNGFVIVTQDSDFYERALVLGFPPKVLCLRFGNVSTEFIQQALQKNYQEIIDFDASEYIACLEMY